MVALVKSGFKHSIYQDAILDDGTMFKGGWAGQGIQSGRCGGVQRLLRTIVNDSRRSEEHLWWSKRRRGKAVAHSVSLHLSLAVL